MSSRGLKSSRPGPHTLPWARGLGERIWDTCLQCWEISPVERPMIEEVLKAFDVEHTSPTLKTQDTHSYSSTLVQTLGAYFDALLD